MLYILSYRDFKIQDMIETYVFSGLACVCDGDLRGVQYQREFE